MCAWFSVLKTSFKICYLSVCSIALCMVRTGKFCSRRREVKAWHRLMEFTKMITWQKDTAGRVCFRIVGHTIATKCIVDISVRCPFIYIHYLVKFKQVQQVTDFARFFIFLHLNVILLQSMECQFWFVVDDNFNWLQPINKNICFISEGNSKWN